MTSNATTKFDLIQVIGVLFAVVVFTGVFLHATNQSVGELLTGRATMIGHAKQVEVRDLNADLSRRFN